MTGPTTQDAERFAREARLLATLEHPGIVRYVAHGQTAEGQPFLAMEWLQGHDLAEHLGKQQQLTAEESLLLVRQVAEALAVAHRRGIVHRDLKPSNLFLRDGEIARVTVLDFGIARDANLTRALTQTGALMGTPGYMAPEQARGQVQLTPSADIFSLGCLLYECLTGRPPFVGEHLEAILVKILFEPEPPLRALRPDLPPWIEQLIAQMLVKDSAARLQSAVELLEAMRTLEPPADSPSEPPSRARAPVQALTTSEQQLVSVLIMRMDDDQGLDATLNSTQEEESRQQLLSLCDVLKERGARPELLPDGTLVAAVTSSRGEAATDQAQRAACCALLVRERYPDALVALATGRGMLNTQLPIGEAINRAVQLSHSHKAPKNDHKAPASSVSGDGLAVIIDSVTAGLLSSRYRTVAIDRDTAALLHEQVGLDETRRLLGKPTPCVGRESELGQLDAILGACIEEATPRAILVVAPPGLGKSRLRHEFLRRVVARGEDILVLMGRGEVLLSGAPFVPLREALLSLCEVQPGDTAAERCGKLWRRLGRLLPDSLRTRVVTFLGELAGVHFSDEQDEELRHARHVPRQMEECIRQAFVDFLSAECAAHPVILVLEDLHFGDASSVALVDAALRELSDRALFVLALARPEVNDEFPRLWHDRVQLMPLRPLSRKASELLVRKVLGLQTPDQVTARIVERAAGNALYLEELIRAAAEDKSEAVPQTVLAMLQARISRLEAGARRALRAASIFGENCWSGGVAALLGMARGECERWLVYLIREELLEQRPESRFPSEIEYHFRHALMRDAAYGLLSDSDRVLGHRLAGGFLEAVGERSQTLAYHFQEAGDAHKALHYSLKAGEDAARLGLVADERRHYSVARQLLRRLPDSPDLRRLHADIVLRQVRTGLTNDSREVQLQRIAEVRASLGMLGAPADLLPEDILRLAQVDYCCGCICHYSGRPNEAIRYFRLVQPVAERLNDSDLSLYSSLGIATGQAMLGHFGALRERLEWILGPLEQLEDRIEWIRAQAYYVLALSAVGRVKDAAAAAERGLAVVVPTNHAPELARFRILLAGAHIITANWPAALGEGQTVLELAQSIGDKLYFFTAWDVIAVAESALGRHDEAFAHREKAKEARRSFGGGVWNDWMEAAHAQMLLNAGRTAEALELARTVAAASKPAGLLVSLALAERTAGCALFRLGGELKEAEAHFAAALAACREGSQLVTAALIEVAWGRELLRRGETGLGQPHLDRGLITLERAGADYALDELRKERLP